MPHEHDTDTLHGYAADGRHVGTVELNDGWWDLVPTRADGEPVRIYQYSDRADAEGGLRLLGAATIRASAGEADVGHHHGEPVA